jgi:hypothetical protein
MAWDFVRLKSFAFFFARLAPRALAAGAFVSTPGCNALLGNADHAIASDDGGATVFFDAGPPGATGASEPDAAVSAPDAQTADVQTIALDGALGATGPADSGNDTTEGGDANAPIAFVQATSKDSKNSVTSVSVTYPNAQQAGDLAVVVVGFSDATHNVSAISDSAGNAYVLATSPASASGVALAVYAAANIAGGPSNTVTVALDASDFLCVAILEYSGVSRIDRTAAGAGSGTSASTGTVTTTVPRELVFGAGEPDQNGNANFTSAGSGFNERLITGISGMLAEDTITTQAGTYAATGGLNSSSAWVMQVVTFK